MVVVVVSITKQLRSNFSKPGGWSRSYPNSCLRACLPVCLPNPPGIVWLQSSPVPPSNVHSFFTRQTPFPFVSFRFLSPRNLLFSACLARLTSITSRHQVTARNTARSTWCAKTACSFNTLRCSCRRQITQITKGHVNWDQHSSGLCRS